MRRSLDTAKTFWELMYYKNLLLLLWIRFWLLGVRATAVLFKTALSSMDIYSTQVISQNQIFQKAALLWSIDSICGQIFCVHFFSLYKKHSHNNLIIKINLELLWENICLFDPFMLHHGQVCTAVGFEYLIILKLFIFLTNLWNALICHTFYR